MQGSDKKMFDASDKIVAFLKKLLLWKEDKGNLSWSSQCFTLLSNLLENTCMMLPSNLRRIFLQHPS